MRISRVLVPSHYEPFGELTVQGETSHYLKTVLRLKKGYRLVIFDGQGTECEAIIEGFGRDMTHLRLGSPKVLDRETPLKVSLGLGISRGERMDFAIQKAVELGVQRISPLLTEFCVVRLDDEKKELRRAHWLRVIQSALEQCGRNQTPRIDPPILLDDWLESPKDPGPLLMLTPNATQGLKEMLPTPNSLTLLIGPEGGLSGAEVERALARGHQPVHLGPRILRTETAVIAALSAVQTLWGDLGQTVTNP